MIPYPLQNIDLFVETCRAFLGYEKPGRVAQGILGSEPGHPFFTAAVQALPGQMPYQGNNLTETCPDFLAQVFRRYANGSAMSFLDEEVCGRRAATLVRDELGVFEPWVFYPYYMGENWEPEVHADSFAVHHWAGSWL